MKKTNKGNAMYVCQKRTDDGWGIRMYKDCIVSILSGQLYHPSILTYQNNWTLTYAILRQISYNRYLGQLGIYTVQNNFSCCTSICIPLNGPKLFPHKLCIQRNGCIWFGLSIGSNISFPPGLQAVKAFVLVFSLSLWNLPFSQNANNPTGATISGYANALPLEGNQS